MKEKIRKDLEALGITGVKDIHYNPSFEELFKMEMDPSLTGYDKGQLTELNAINVMTGIYTGRSPKDKYIVMDANSKNTVWWTSEEYKNDNHPMSEEVWGQMKDLAVKELSNKELYVVDAYCGANKDTRIAVRFIMEVAWQAHFVTNMFIRPSSDDLKTFTPSFTVYTASKAKVENYKELGLNSETCVAFNVTSREQVILNTWYGGEMKKGMFSMMNYYLPLQGIASMHCSANTDMEGKNTAIFFGLSGTGKTTLSTDPKRLLIGDDEHGWDDDGVFNFEGGCYAKVINLDKDSEPDIYNAIRRNALLENVTVDANGKLDFADKSVTENTRVSYPIDHIEKIVRPVSAAPAAKNVIFLSADAFGVLPPVSILTPDQCKYYFLSGFTAKLAGTERGITEPTPTFSACFGQAFLELHPTKYAEELVKRMEKSGAKAYLVNTGWNGTGKRSSINDTRGIIDAILDGSIEKAPTKKIPYFDFEVPTELPGVDPKILDPRDTYGCACELSCEAGQEVRLGLLRGQDGDRRQYAESVSGKEDHVLSGRACGDRVDLQDDVLDVAERIGDTGVLCDALVREIDLAGSVHGDVLEEGVAGDGVVDVGLGFLVKVDDLGIAAALVVEDAGIVPAVLVVADEETLGVGGKGGLAGAGQAEEDSGVLAFLIGVGGAVHGSNALERQIVVHHGEEALLHLAAVPGVKDDLLTAGDVEEDCGLGVKAELFIVLNFRLGSVVADEIGLEVLKLLCRGNDEHILDKVCLPCDFDDEADRHAGILVGAAECIDDEKTLVGEFLQSERFAGCPCLLGGRVVVVRILIAGPPDGVLGVFIHNDKFILGRTAGVNAGHDIDSAQLSLDTFVKALKVFVHFFIVKKLIGRVVDDLGYACDTILCQIKICHSSTSFWNSISGFYS